MSGAAGSGEFVAEEVRSEADAFGHGEVRGPGVGELGDGESGFDGVGRGEHHLAGGVGEGVDSEDFAGVGVGDDLDAAAGVVVGDGSGHVGQSQVSAGASVSGGDGFGFGDPGRGELG